MWYEILVKTAASEKINTIRETLGPGPQDKSPRGKGNQQRRDDTFEMTIDEIKAVEYNFEENLAKFDKRKLLWCYYYRFLLNIYVHKCT